MKKRESIKRNAFTLVELLVVIAIIGVLVGLTLPAVQMARASARQSECMNNIRQVSLAVIGYQTNNGTFPYYQGNPGCWVIPLLPALGEESLGNSWLEGNTPTKAIPTLFCPSHPRKRNLAAPLSYAANCGFDGYSTSKKIPMADVGAFSKGPATATRMESLRNSVDRIASLDGTSYTILFGENTQSTQWNSTSLYEYGILWGGGVTTAYGQDHKSTSSNAAHARPASYHPGQGAHLAFADAHVVYAAGVDATVYKQLMSPSDKQGASISGTSAMNNFTDFGAILGR
ncbi:MAG: DUF1559 domain-containing protein [Planctomycetia bacterium]|nr:DUF1559 domain-containing protein [Planctomycetia bacterium]